MKLPYRGAPQTVATMKHAALKSQGDYQVRVLAESICAGLPTKDYLSEAVAIYHFTLARTRYMRDPRTVELVRAPNVVVGQLMSGHTPSLDCDDMGAFIGALALATGAEVRLVTVAFQHAFYRGLRQYSHVFCQAREPRTGVWIALDPVAGRKTNEMLDRVVAAAFWPVA